MAVLPSEIPTGLVTGQFYFVNEDNIDADTDPELLVVTGKVTFTCEAKEPLRMPTKKAVIIPMTFDAEFDSQGRLVPLGRTDVGIELPASNSPLFNPTNFTWKVEFDLKEVANDYSVVLPSFSIFIPEGETWDIVDLMPVSMDPGTIMIQGPQGEVGPQGETGPVRSVGTVETVTGPSIINVGPTGMKGDKGDPGGIVNPSPLAAGTDWNTVIASGMYSAAGGDMAGMPNSAPSMAIGVNLMVQARGSTIVTQIAWTVSNAHSQIQFQRSLVSGVWGPWKVYRNTTIDQTAGRAVYLWDELNNRSQLIYGDTGLRSMPLPSNVTSGVWFLRREGYKVSLYTQFTGINNNTGQDLHNYEVMAAATIPAGFQPPVSVPLTGFGRVGASNQRQPLTAFLYANGRIALEKDETNANGAIINNAAVSFYFSATFDTTQAWPTTLPGTASGSIPNL